MCCLHGNGAQASEMRIRYVNYRQTVHSDTKDLCFFCSFVGEGNLKNGLRSGPSVAKYKKKEWKKFIYSWYDDYFRILYLVARFS